MHVINVMFGRGLGGIEQSFTDYSEALWVAGHDVTAMIHPDAQIAEYIKSQPISTLSVRNRGEWDYYAVYRIKRTLRKLAPDVIICHGNRAISLMRKAAKGICPVVGVTHNYRLKRFDGLDAIFALTKDLVGQVTSLGVAPDAIHYIPNMIKLEECEPNIAAYQSPPVIGAIGRFVEKKGFHVFVESLALLKERGHAFTAHLAGEGAQQKKLRALVKKHGLTKKDITFTGWVANRSDFYTMIDIFCLPSLHEAFGIVLLEAYAHQLPVVTTDTEGPNDISSPDADVLMVEKNNAVALADGLEQLLSDQKKARALAAAGRKKVEEQFALPVVSQKIDTALKQIVGHA